MTQLIPLPLTVSCCSKIQIGFTFLVSAHLGSPEQMAVKQVCVCVCVCVCACVRVRACVSVFQLDHQQCKGLICLSVHCSQLTPNHLAATHQYVVLVPTYMEQTYDCDLQLSPFGTPVSLLCSAGCKQQQCEMLTSRWTAQCHKLSLP